MIKLKNYILLLFIICSNFTFAQKPDSIFAKQVKSTILQETSISNEILDSYVLNENEYKIVNNYITKNIHNQICKTSLSIDIRKNDNTIKTIFHNKNKNPNTYRKIEKCVKLIVDDKILGNVLFFDWIPSCPGNQNFTFIKITPEIIKIPDTNEISNGIYSIRGKIKTNDNNIILNNNRFNLILNNHLFSFSLPVLISESDSNISMLIDTSSIIKKYGFIIFNLPNNYYNFVKELKNNSEFEISLYPNCYSSDSEIIKTIISKSSKIKILKAGISDTLIDFSNIQTTLYDFSRHTDGSIEAYFNNIKNYKIGWCLKIELNGRIGWIKKIMDYKNLGFRYFG